MGWLLPPCSLCLVSVSLVPHQVLQRVSDELLKELKVGGGTHYQLKKNKMEDYNLCLRWVAKRANS